MLLSTAQKTTLLCLKLCRTIVIMLNAEVTYNWTIALNLPENINYVLHSFRVVTNGEMVKEQPLQHYLTIGIKAIPIMKIMTTQLLHKHFETLQCLFNRSHRA